MAFWCRYRSSAGLTRWSNKARSRLLPPRMGPRVRIRLAPPASQLRTSDRDLANGSAGALLPIRDGEQWGVAKIKARLWTPPDSTAILTICHIVARRADLAGHNPKLGSECFCGKRGISFYPGIATVPPPMRNFHRHVHPTKQHPLKKPGRIHNRFSQGGESGELPYCAAGSFRSRTPLSLGWNGQS